MKADRRSFPLYGAVGLLILGGAEILLFLRLWIIPTFFTPIVWTGYILFVDALNYMIRGESLIQTRPKEFLLMLPWSVFCWFVFELYNLHLQNWVYLGLPQNLLVRMVGYLWAFATIFPAVLETAELFHPLYEDVRMKPWKISPNALRLHLLIGGRVFRIRLQNLSLVGFLFLIAPLLVSSTTAHYLIPFVWMGFAFLLEPINYMLGGRSVFHYFEMGELKQFLGLLSAGIVCGLLWEFWNYGAEGRWLYKIPFPWAGPKIFEMPLLGFLGFLPFAVECHAMQNYLLAILNRRKHFRDKSALSRA